MVVNNEVGVDIEDFVGCSASFNNLQTDYFEIDHNKRLAARTKSFRLYYTVHFK